MLMFLVFEFLMLVEVNLSYFKLIFMNISN